MIPSDPHRKVFDLRESLSQQKAKTFRLPIADAKKTHSLTVSLPAPASLDDGELLTVTLRSVNHRGLDLHFHPNGPLAQFENAIRNLVKKHIARGHIEIRLSLPPDAEAETVTYNRGLLKRYVMLFRQACAEFEIDRSRGSQDVAELLTQLRSCGLVS